MALCKEPPINLFKPCGCLLDEPSIPAIQHYPSHQESTVVTVITRLSVALGKVGKWQSQPQRWKWYLH